MATVKGTAGADVLPGTVDGDYFTINDPLDTIVESTNGGIDWAYSFIPSYTLAANVENLILRAGAINGTGNELNNLIFGNDDNNVLDGGAGNDQLYGGLGNDTLIGGEGNDYLDGGAGNDRMIGGLGNDTYVVDSYSDVIVEAANGGTDKVLASISYALAEGSNLENLSLLDGFGALNATGNSLDNVLVGNNDGNIIYGLSGADTIYGRGGNDSLFGGDGNDFLYGGDGNDFLNGGTGADYMEGGDGNDSYVVDNAGDVVNDNGTGTDVVYLMTTANGSGFDLANAATVENLIMKTGAATDTYGYGNALNNTIIGTAADNVIMGREGNDYLTGGGGNDKFVLSSAATNGTDIITDFNTGDKIVINTSDYAAGTTIYDSGMFPSSGSSPGFVLFGTNLVYMNGSDVKFLVSTNGHNLVASDLQIV
jgi:Ca2+-binding RTX toxin-like protein